MSATAETSLPRVKTKDAWKKAGVHTVGLSSGVEVDIRIPNLPQMVKAGEVPNDLLDAALGAMKKQEITPDLIKEQADFFHLLVSTMVVEPALSPDEVPEVVPFEDIELLVELGTRQRDIDALGRQIAGLHKSAEWRKFRGWDYGDETLEDD
jgi:hypothetical protein